MKTSVLLITLLLILNNSVEAQIWSYTDDPGGLPATYDSHLSYNGLHRVNGAIIPGTPCQVGFSSTNFSSTIFFSNTLAAVEFYVKPNNSYRMTVTSISAGLRRSANGPGSIRFAYSLDNGITWITQNANQTPLNGTCGMFVPGTWDMPDFNSVSLIKFRIYGFNALTTGGTQQLLQIKVFGSVTLADVDGDGYYDDVDCNDNNAAINPGAFENCNEADEDCNGSNDNIPVQIFRGIYGGDIKGQYTAGIKMQDDGSVIVAGYTFATSGDIPISHGGSDMFLMSLAANGTISWVKTYGGPFSEYCYDFIQTADGGFVLVGGTSSSSGDITGYHGGEDFWVVKTDALGNIQWQRALGGAAQEYATKVLETADGGYIIAGTTASNDGDVSGNHGGNDVWVTKLNNSGSLQWAKAFGGSTPEFYYGDIVQAPDGGYFISFSSSSTDGDAVGNHGSGDLLMIKTDANGNKIWSKMFGSPNFDGSPTEIVVNPDGSCLIGTEVNGNGGDVSGFHGTFNTDVWIFKIDIAGNLLWQRPLGGSGFESFSHLQRTPDGNFLMSATSRSIDGDVIDHPVSIFSSNVDADLWFVKINDSGNVIWTKTTGIQGLDDYNSSKAYFNDERYIISWPSTFLQLGYVSLSANGVEEWRRFQFIYTTDNNPATPAYLYSDGNVNGKYVVCATALGEFYDFEDVFATMIRTKPLEMWLDTDGDGYGDTEELETTICGDVLPGYVLNDSDCNPGDSTIYPGAADICNSIDDNCDNVIDENAFTASVSPSGSVTICKGVNLILTASGGTGITYQWLNNAANISGATAQTYSLTKAASYAVKETNAFNCTSTSPATIVTVKTLPTATINPLGSLDICGTGSVVLQAVTNNGTTYQWKKGSTVLAGATNQNYTATVKGTYKVTITNNSGCSKISDGAVVTKSCRTGDIKELNDLSVFPNPAAEQTTLQFTIDHSAFVAIGVYDMNGKLVQEVLNELVDEGNHSLSLNTAVLARGMYTIRIKSGEGFQMEKLVLQ